MCKHNSALPGRQTLYINDKLFTMSVFLSPVHRITKLMQNSSGRAYVNGDEGTQAVWRSSPTHSPPHSHSHTHTLLNSFVCDFTRHVFVVCLTVMSCRIHSVHIYFVCVFVWEWDVSLSFTSPTHFSFFSLLFLQCLSFSFDPSLTIT